jgi:capsular exopolysaccharide synthesis family protein
MRGTQRQFGTGSTGIRKVAAHLPGIALCALVGVLAGLLVAAFAADRFTAQTTLLLRTPAIDNGIVASAAPPSQEERPYRTHVELLESSAVQERARERLQAAAISDPTRAVEAVDIDVASDSNLAIVSAESASAGRSAAIADQYARAYLDVRRASLRSRLGDLATALERRAELLAARGGAGAGADAVERRASQLRLLASVEPADAQILRLAPRPRQADTGPYLRYGLVGLIAGLLIGIAVAVLRARRTRRLRDADELEELLGVPLLAAVPRSRALDGRTLPSDLPMIEAETFRMLRANLLHMDRRQPLRSVLVTSAHAGEGKSLVAFNLAAALAATGNRVLLVEADIRDPTVSRLLGVASGDGLSEVLLGDQHIAGAVREVPGPRGGGESHTFDVLAAGLARVHAAELLGTDRMKRVLAEAVEIYDVVVIDTPPLSIVSDAIPMLDQVDAVVAVAGVGRVPVDELVRLRALFERTHAPLVGVVANFVEPRDEADYGSYATAPGPAVRSANRRNGRPARSETEVMSR